MFKPNVKEFHRSYMPLLYITKICGLLPNKLEEVNGGLIIRKSIFGIIQTLALITLYSGMVYFLKINNITVKELEGVSLVIEQIQVLSFNFIFYMLTLSAFMNRTGFLKIIQSILKLDTLLFKLGESIHYKNEFKRNLTLVALVCMILGIIGIVKLLTCDQLDLIFVIYTLMWFVPLVFLHIVELQFSMLVFSVKLRCSKLNNSLSKLTVNFNDEQKFNSIATVNIEYQNLQIGGDDIRHTVYNLSTIYDFICDIHKTINRVFSFRITFVLAIVSVFLTFIMYGIAVEIKNENQLYQGDSLIMSILIMTINASSMFGVIYCCGEAKSEAEQVAILLHRVKPRKMEDRVAINTFSLRSVHQRVQLTACGLFHLDYTFIYLVISTITTYMVILVQFA